MAVSDFNVDQDLRDLPSLQVQKRDGTIIPVPAGTVTIQAGANILVETDVETDEITISTSEGRGLEDPYFREKYEALANTPESGAVTGGDGSPGHPAWTFTSDARWLATMNAIHATAADFNFFLNNSDCTSFGLFDQEEASYAEDTADILRITDVCAPASNILTIKKLLEYTNRLKVCYDYILAVLDNKDPENPPIPPEDISVLPYDGFLQQVQTVRHYWNYLVNRASVKFNAIASGQGVSFSCYFHNTSDESLGDPVDGMKVEVTLDLYKRIAGVLTPWGGLAASSTELRPITRDSGDDPPDKLLGWDSTFNVNPMTATATFRTIKDSVIYQLPSNGELYTDGAILFKNMEDFDDGSEYVMRMTAKVYYTHMDITVERVVDVYFTPPVNPTPAP